jgi:hypothetical protein
MLWFGSLVLISMIVQSITPNPNVAERTIEIIESIIAALKIADFPSIYGARITPDLRAEPSSFLIDHGVTKDVKAATKRANVDARQ